MTSNDDVAHWFAEGKKSGKTKHMFIEGDTIYSYGYHFPIAKKIGSDVYLFNKRGYSHTTAVQKGKVRRALHGTIIEREL